MEVSAAKTADKFKVAHEKRGNLYKQAEDDKRVKKESILIIKNVKNNMALVQRKSTELTLVNEYF